MISEAFSRPISHVATKNFTHLQKLMNPKKPSIQKIFFDNWEDFLTDEQVIKNGLRDVVVRDVERMLTCGTIDAGFEIFECSNCLNTHIICYTCKSRFCPSCGAKYVKARAANISKTCLDVKHRHIVFTIDERLRSYFSHNRNLLNILFEAVKQTLFYAFNKLNGKHDSFIPGIIMSLHTFGRSLNWNPHIHCLVTEGGMNDQHIYKRVKYLHYETLRKSFMRTLLYLLRDSFKDDPYQLASFKQLIHTLYNDHANGFYVYAPPLENRKSNDAVVDYIIRYSGRPAMAQSRIIHYDFNLKQITYYYEDHTTKQRVEVQEHVFLFMKKLIRHIPESQFKMIRYYGLYASSSHSHKQPVCALIAKGERRSCSSSCYRLDLIDTFGVDPLLCSCGQYMLFVDCYVPSCLGGNKNGPI